MNSGLNLLALIAGSLPGSILLSLGHTLAVVSVYFNMVRALSVPQSRRCYLANTVFMTLATWFRYQTASRSIAAPAT